MLAKWYKKVPQGESPQRLLLTGSANFTGRSLYKNFEIILEVRDEDIYQQCLDHFGAFRKL